MVQTRNQDKHSQPEEAQDEPSTKRVKHDKGSSTSGGRKKNKPKTAAKPLDENDQGQPQDTREDIVQNTTSIADDVKAHQRTAVLKGNTRGAVKTEDLSEETKQQDIHEAMVETDHNPDETKISVNRAPVLSLWATAVSERLGFSTDEAYSYAQWIAGTLAQAKGRKLGVLKPSGKSQKGKKAKSGADVEGRREEHVDDDDFVMVFGNMKIPTRVVDGKRLAVKGGKVIDPVPVKAYVEKKFGDNLEKATLAMGELAQSMPADQIRERAYELYEQFRPEWHGWGKEGTLDLEEVHELAVADDPTGEGEDEDDE
jgi:hypothetical protein